MRGYSTTVGAIHGPGTWLATSSSKHADWSRSSRASSPSTVWTCKVQRGQIHALIGPNGAGKTTCFNLLTKFLIPTRGQILFKGHDITHEKPAQIARRGIIRSFQISATFPHLTVLRERAHGAAAHAGHLVPLLEVRALAGRSCTAARSSCSTPVGLRELCRAT